MSVKKSDVTLGVFMMLAMEYMTVAAVLENAQLHKWVWFGVTMFEFAFVNWLAGWMMIDSFNKWQGRRRRNLSGRR